MVWVRLVRVLVVPRSCRTRDSGAGTNDGHRDDRRGSQFHATPLLHYFFSLSPSRVPRWRSAYVKIVHAAERPLNPPVVVVPMERDVSA